MKYRSIRTTTGKEELSTITPAILFSFAAFLLMLLAIVPEPAAALPLLALGLMVQLTRLLGVRLYRDFTD